MPNFNIYNRLYQDHTLQKISLHVPRIDSMYKLITSNVNLQNIKILDIGSHDGSFLHLFDKYSKKLYGLEASQAAAKQANSSGISTKVYFFDDITPFPHPDNSFDLVIAGEIIEHIYNTDFFLQEIHRVLKSNGYLLLSTPNVASLGRRLMLLAGISPILEPSPNHPHSVGHIRYYTFKTLSELLTLNHFSPLKMISENINFDIHGRLSSHKLAQVFPTLGQSIITLSRKSENKL